MNHTSLALLVFTALISQNPSPSEKTWTWVGEVEEEIWKRISVVAEFEDLHPLQEDDEWILLVTAHDGHSHQWQLLFRKQWRSDPSVKYIHLAGNLASQLAELRERDSQITPDVAVSRLSTNRGGLTSRSCPPVDRLVEDFERLEVPVLPENVLRLDPASYSVDVISQYRDDRRMVVYDDENALSAWCAAAIQAVLECSPKKPAN